MIHYFHGSRFIGKLQPKSGRRFFSAPVEVKSYKLMMVLEAHQLVFFPGKVTHPSKLPL